MPIATSQYPVSFDLSELDGFNGFTLNGIKYGNRAGSSVASAGDVNGDKFNDIIVSAPNAGQSYVVFGHNKIWNANFDLSNLNGMNGYIINGGTNLVASAGDINGDKLADIIICMGDQVYIIFGSSQSWNASLNLSDLDGYNGFVLNVNGDCGSVASAGDMNGDGLDDVIIGVPWASQSYVIFGSYNTWLSQFNLSALNGINGFVINGIAAGDWSGSSVASAGDLNGDKLSDIIVDAFYASPNGNYQIGQSYVIFGHNKTWNATFDLSSLNGANGFTINGGGASVAAIEIMIDGGANLVASAGDINGDGFDDIVIDGGLIIFGHNKAWSANFDLGSLNGTNGFIINEWANSIATSAGDVNGDGISDLLIGAPNINNKEGQGYVIFGHNKTWEANFYLSNLNGQNGLSLNAINMGSELGFSVASAGDINGDKLSDIILGAPSANYSAGQSYVIFGGTQNFTLVSNQLSIQNGKYVIPNITNLFTIPIIDTILFSVSQLEHGQFELLDSPGLPISNFLQSQIAQQQVIFYHDGSNIAPRYSIACSSPYSVWGGIINPQPANINFTFGSVNQQFLSNYNLANLNGASGFKINGIHIKDQSGLSVASVDNFNGNKLSEIIIGAPYANNANGQCYVIFGSYNIFNESLSLLDLDVNNGIILDGVDNLNYVDTIREISVASAGDVNGDGLDDIIIGVPAVSDEAYLIFGSYSFFNTTISLSNLNGYNGVTLNSGYDDISGSIVPVAAAGDFNHDGFNDIIIGNVLSQSYLVFGKQAPWNPNLNLLNLNGQDGFIINGGGSSVASAGDINGDGFSDVIIGAFDEVNNSGQLYSQVYIIFGNNTHWYSTFSLQNLNGQNGFLVNIGSNDDESPEIGNSVASAGDINDDGFSDIIIGAVPTGQVYVIFGNKGPWNRTLDLESLNGQNGLVIDIDFDNFGDSKLGVAVASAGDINGDGISDIIIGSPAGNSDAGQSYIVFGHLQPWNKGLSLSDLNGRNGFALNGINQATDISEGDQSGSSVASAGDINGDGITDLIIGAPFANSEAGQSYVVFGSYQFLQLASNQLTISNGQSIQINSKILSIRSFTYPRALVRFSISNITNGWFESTTGNYCGATSSANSITAFTQEQIDAGEIAFVHDGSSNAPNYTVSFATSAGLLGFSEPQFANINFVTYLSLDNIKFTVNQYQQKINLLNSSILATNSLNKDPSQIKFVVHASQNGWFAMINNSNVILHSFTQQEINQDQICFYSPCGVNSMNVLPGFNLSATSLDGLTTAITPGTVLYNPAPVITQNAIAVGQQQSVILTQANIAATDVNSSSVNASGWYDPNIQFTVKHIVDGYFQNIQNQSRVMSFAQSQIMKGNIEFVSTSAIAPTYNLTVTDMEGASSLPQAGQVTFQQSSQSSASSSNAVTVAASVAIGGVAAAGLGLFLLNRRNNNRLHAYIEQASDKDNSLNKIAEVIFEKIKLTGFLNHIQKNRVTEYVNAIKEILEALTAMGFPVDLATMTEKSRNHFLAEFPRQIKGAFPVSQQSRMQFFKSEIKPRQIKLQAQHIASNIKHMMDMIESQILDDNLEGSSDIQLIEVSSHSGDRAKGLQEFLIKDEEERQEERVSRCFVM